MNIIIEAKCGYDICIWRYHALITQLSTRAGIHDMTMNAMMMMRRSQSESSEDSAVVERPGSRSTLILTRIS